MNGPDYKAFIFPRKSNSTKEGCSTILLKMNTLLTYMYLLWKIKKNVHFNFTNIYGWNTSSILFQETFPQ